MAENEHSAEFDIPDRGLCEGGGKLLVSDAGSPGSRRTWYAEVSGGWDHGNEISITERASGEIMIEVTEEKAVDSYNEFFTCSMTLPAPAAKALRDWLKERSQ